MKNILTKSLLSFITIYASTFAFGQQANFEWAKSFGGIGYDTGLSIAVDAAGNIYTTGLFSGTVDFDPGTGTSNLTSAGGHDVFIQKLDAAGNFIWAKSFGGTFNDFGSSIKVDASGNVFTTGMFRGAVDFDPGAGTSNLTSVGGPDVFVIKLDALGNFIWAKTFGSTGYDAGVSITVDASGNVYTTGHFQGTADFDPSAGTSNLTSVGNFDTFVQKLDASGNFQWAKSFGGTSDDSGSSITVDASGNVYATGYFAGTVDFDPGMGMFNLYSAGGFDPFVQKLDSSGNFVWAKTFGNTGYDIGRSITVDASGSVYTTGLFSGTVDFDPGAGTLYLNCAGNYDTFVQKLDSSGNFQWAKVFGGANNDRGNSTTLDAFGNIYTVGWFKGTVDFDPSVSTFNLSSTGMEDVFIQKLDASGNFIGAKAFGGTGTDIGGSITVDASGNVYTTGYFDGTADFDPSAGTSNLNSAGGYDVFVQKISQCTANTGTDVQTACNSYQWIDGNTYTASNNSATYTLTNTAGCDSVVTLDLTIFNSTFGTDVITACSFYTWIDGNTYTASNNSATFTLTNIHGCDSVVTLDLTINNSSVGIDFITACDSYTWINGITYTASNNSATHTLTNATGCDSLIILNLIINSVDNSVIESGITLTANLAGASYQWIDCNDNNNPIAGETNQSYTATANGSYAVIVNDGNCSDTSICYAVIGVDAESIKETAVNIYPNPTNGLIFVQGEGIEKIVVTDVNGRVIEQLITSQQQVTLDLTGNVQGIYFVNIETKNGRIIRKILLK